MRLRNTFILAAAMAVAAISSQANAQLSIIWSTIDGGGGTCAGGSLTLHCTIGQHDAGSQMTGGGLSLAGGYWARGTNPGPTCGSADFNCDGDTGTDQDIEAFFACLVGNCPSLPCTSNADFNGDGDTGTDQDIEAFFRVLVGQPC
jgi:hypothetical protein